MSDARACRPAGRCPTSPTPWSASSAGPASRAAASPSASPLAGQRVVLGSARRARAAAVAAEVGHGVTGRRTPTARRRRTSSSSPCPGRVTATLLAALVDELAGKVVVDCVNPLGFDSRVRTRWPSTEGSAAEQAAAVLPDSRVVGAFHHVSAVLLLDPTVASFDTDVLVVGDDRARHRPGAGARRAASPGCAGSTPAGCATRSQVEALTANLISVNRRYKAHAGVRVTDV